MFLKQHHNKKTGRIHLTIVQGFRENGKVKHKTVEVLGYLDELEKKYDDPVAHFKEEVRRRNEESAEEANIQINLKAELPQNSCERKNLGYAPLKSIYSSLGLHDFFQYKQRFIGADFNLNSIFSMLIFNRMLAPSSKKKAYEEKGNFFESFRFSLDDVYRSLDYFWSYSNEIQQLLAEKTKEFLGRDNELGYYDVTNYYFEIPYEDEDEKDDEGNIIRTGQKKLGPSKEKRRAPIVQMGLLMDSNGIPLAFNLFPGNESEKVNMLPTIRRAKNDLNMERIIVVADRGLNTSDNTAYLSGINYDDCKSNDGYVYGQSIAGAGAEFKKWVLNQSGYTVDEEETPDGNTVRFRHKSRIFAKDVTLKNSKGKRNLTTQIYQKQMVYYSEKYAHKQKYERERLVAKANNLIASPAGYTRATSYGAAAYVNNLKFDKETGEIAEGSSLSLNQKKIDQEALFDGYYSIVTSELNLEDAEIRNIYKGLWEIEESFKIIKSEFKARPVFVKNDEHVGAHFLICFVSLVIMRVLEKMLDEKYTTRQLRDAMIRYSCSYIDQGYYLFDFRNEVTDAIGKKFGWDLSAKYMSKSSMKKILKYKK
jgi:hypothetical protein